MKILTKYILKEIIGPLMFSMFAFTSMFSGFAFLHLLKEAERYHLSVVHIFQLLALRLPEYMIQSAPIAVLMATLLGLGNLTSHSETIAMRAGGFNFSRLVVPVIIIGTVISISGIAMNEYVVPAGLRAYEQLKVDAIQKEKSAVVYNFSRDFFNQDNGEIEKRIYAGRYEPKYQQLRDVTIEEFAEKKPHRIITTTVMHWNGEGWFFKDGLIYQLNTNHFYPIKVEKGYVKYDLNLTPKEIKNFDEDPDQKSISELRKFIDKYYQRGSERQRLLVDYHLKFAIPFASLILAWLGAPLALRPQRRSSAAGFGLCIVFILIWYALMGLGTYMARAGALPPFIGAWLPNLVLAGYGAYITVHTKS